MANLEGTTANKPLADLTAEIGLRPVGVRDWLWNEFQHFQEAGQDVFGDMFPDRQNDIMQAMQAAGIRVVGQRPAALIERIPFRPAQGLIDRLGGVRGALSDTE